MEFLKVIGIVIFIVILATPPLMALGSGIALIWLSIFGSAAVAIAGKVLAASLLTLIVEFVIALLISSLS